MDISNHKTTILNSIKAILLPRTHDPEYQRLKITSLPEQFAKYELLTKTIVSLTMEIIEMTIDILTNAPHYILHPTEKLCIETITEYITELPKTLSFLLKECSQLFELYSDIFSLEKSKFGEKMKYFSRYVEKIEKTVPQLTINENERKIFENRPMMRSIFEKEFYHKGKLVNKSISQFIVCLRNFLRKNNLSLLSRRLELERESILMLEITEIESIVNIIFLETQNYVQFTNAIVEKDANIKQLEYQFEPRDLWKELNAKTTKRIRGCREIEMVVKNKKGKEEVVKGKSENEIKSATMAGLIEELTTPTEIDHRFCEVFYNTFSLFTTAKDVIDNLITRYNVPEKVTGATIIKERTANAIFDIVEINGNDFPVELLEYIQKMVKQYKIDEKRISSSIESKMFSVHSYLHHQQSILSIPFQFLFVVLDLQTIPQYI